MASLRDQDAGIRRAMPPPKRSTRPTGSAPDALGGAVGACDAAVTTRGLFRSLEVTGLSEREAGNLVGLLYGLRPVPGGWTLHEIEHLRFIRAGVEGGHPEP